MKPLAELQGVFGGTFDPIHNGHLAVAEYLTEHCHLSQIQFVPCLLPPHRQQPRATPQQRLSMLRLALENHPQWIANDIDYQRPAPSYMVDTLTILRGRQPHTPWCLILGMDAFQSFNQWREWEQIFTLSHLIVVNRPGFQLPNQEWSDHLLAQRQVHSYRNLTQSLAGSILIESIPPSPISATGIRELTIEDIEKATPAKVLEFIHQHRLYRTTHTAC